MTGHTSWHVLQERYLREQLLHYIEENRSGTGFVEFMQMYRQWKWRARRAAEKLG